MRAITVLLGVAACSGSGSTNSLDTPANREPAPTASKLSACDTLVISLDSEGTWIGAPPHVACWSVHRAGEVDGDWLKAELARIHGALAGSSCKPEVAITASGSMRYQDLVSAMDLAIQAGFPDTTLDDKPPMTFAGWARTPKCAGDVSRERLATAGPKTAARPVDPDWRKTAAYVGVTKTDLYLNKDVIAPIADLGTEGEIAALGQALRALEQKGVVVLQADATAPATLVMRVVATAKANGFGTPLLAVQNR